MPKLLLKLSVAALALSIASQGVLAETYYGGKRKPGFFESIFGLPAPRMKRPPRKPYPWWKRNSDVDVIYGSRSPEFKNQPGFDYDDPEPIPGLGMGNPTYIAPKLLAVADPAFSKLTAADSQSQAILAELSTLKSPIRSVKDERQAILDHYKSTGFKPVWTTAGAPSERAKAVLALAAKTSEEGLDPLAYLPAGLISFDNIQEQLAGNPQNLARFDIAMTAAVLKLARHMSAGQFEPNRLSLYNDITPERVEAAKALKVLAWSPFPDAYLSDLAPKHAAYNAMKVELSKLRATKVGPAYAKIPNGKTPKVGGKDPRTPALRERMIALSFLSPAQSEAVAAAPNKFDVALSKALKQFQKSAGVKPSGLLDLATVKSLNQDNRTSEIQRLVYNMERVRWLPKNLGSKYVFVNQPAFEVRVMEKSNEVWRSNVIVGRALTQTSAFHDEIETVVFNPSWGVPQSIIVNEYLGKLRRDPGYLDRQGFKVVNEQGKVVSSRSINWGAYGNQLPFAVQQPPGEGNALGELKFLFPNKHDIYMHDTPTRKLFAETTRAFSHGCVRVQNPREFARILLGWDAGKVDQETDGGKSQSVKLRKKVPVHIAYFTAWPDSSGKMVYYGDIYGRDEAMEKALVATAAVRGTVLAQKLVQN
jgi:L,D-transpeptidase YcbB